MPPQLMKLVQFLARRPKDKTLQRLRILTGLVIIVVVFVFRENSTLDLPFGLSQYEETIEYIILALGVIIVIHGITKMCIMKHKHLRILQIVLGLFLIFLGGPIMDPDIETAQSKTSPVSLELGAEGPAVDVPHNPGWALVFLAFIPLVLGITGKGTTSNCMKFGEKIKKIRV